MQKLFLFWHTLKYLKAKQVIYRVKYLIKNKVVSQGKKVNPAYTPCHCYNLRLADLIYAETSYIEGNIFSFLNIRHDFKEQIDWNFAVHGKLWVYNLNYFDFLRQASISKENGLNLMRNFSREYHGLNDAHEPYPTSLRIMNWIRFTGKHQIEDEEINMVIRSDIERLKSNIEYHLLGNHLLENGFALLIASFYLKDHELFQKSSQLVANQLDEQILEDGGHFELSPMYHQILLLRLLDSIDLLRNNYLFEQEQLLEYLYLAAGKMINWLAYVTFNNGEIPYVNDSTRDIAPKSAELMDYATSLNVTRHGTPLSDSGYRKFTSDHVELCVDVGPIGASYIPGHGHSDALNFVLHVSGKPVVVDTGISTYEKNKLRHQQRSTSAHNTVEVNGVNQSQVWGGFRVGKRSTVHISTDQENHVEAWHDGYKRLDVIHTRCFKLIEDKRIIIKDALSKCANAIAYFHFHPDMKIQLIDDQVLWSSGAITFEGQEKIEKISYDYAYGFNTTMKADLIKVYFNQDTTTTITIL